MVARLQTTMCRTVPDAQMYKLKVYINNDIKKIIINSDHCNFNMILLTDYNGAKL
jgi:hypothetical protein